MWNLSKETHRLREELMVAGGKDQGKEQLGSLGHAHTAVFKMDNQQGLTVEHRELCSMLCVSLNGRESGGEWIHVYEWLSPFAVHLNCHNIFCLSAIL